MTQEPMYDEPEWARQMRSDRDCRSLTAEQQAQARVDNERARRAAIIATVCRRVDDRVRMLDPAFRECSHAERVRRLVVQLGEVGALDPGTPWATEDGLQDALVDVAADVQAWLEHVARNAEEGV